MARNWPGEAGAFGRTADDGEEHQQTQGRTSPRVYSGIQFYFPKSVQPDFLYLQILPVWVFAYICVLCWQIGKYSKAK